MSKPNDPKPNPSGEPERDEELGYQDDAIIGKAFRWSAIAFLVLAVIGGTLFLVLRKKAPAKTVRKTAVSAPSRVQGTTVQPPKVLFTDVTKAAGITFVHNSGASGDKLLPETMGAGVAFFDYDGDNDQDLLFVNSTTWPGQPSAAGKTSTPALYQNDGAGNFKEVTAGSGLDVTFYGMGVAAADYDNDGRTDVLFTGVGGNHLFHNEGSGKFREVTAEAGVGGKTNDWSTAATFVDYDNDGRLDLFIANYVRWSREIDLEVGYKIDGVKRAYGQPNNFEGTFPSLFHNEGNGRFTDVSTASGVQVKNPLTGVPAAKTLGVAPVDIDSDGWIDLVLANDTVQNFVFHNQKNGTFKEIGAFTGVAFDSYGAPRGAMGIDSARFRNDTSLGIAIGNFANEMTALYVSQQNALFFTDEAITHGIGPASRLPLKFGLFFFDYDLDGWLDVLTANGHLDEEIVKLQQSQKFRQSAQLFWNCGTNRGPCYTASSANLNGTDLFKEIVGRGSAHADIDQDGDLDVVLTQTGGAPLLLRNDQQLNHHWLRLKLVGKTANRDAIGAWVKATVGGRVVSRQVMPTKSYLSQSELPVTFGLGASPTVSQLEITWPGGRKQMIENPAADRLLIVQEQ